MRWIVALIVALLSGMALAAEPQAPPRFEPPAATLGASTLDDLQAELNRGNLAELATRLDSLLREQIDELMATDEQGLLSVAAWIDALPPARRQALSAAFQKRLDAPAVSAWDNLRQDPAARPESFYALARRYPLSSIAAAAYVEAADRAARTGDAPAALACFALAQRDGWQADEEHARIIEACRALNGQQAANGSEAYRGGLAFEAGWYGQGDKIGMAKVFPLVADGVAYFAGPRHAMAVRNGQIAWRWASSDAWVPVMLGDRPSQRGRGAVFASALFCSPAGAQILIIRQPRPGGRDFCLRALRASDGKLLWDTQAGSALDGISLAGGVAIAGRYVYATAVEFTQATGTLTLVALDLLDGRLIFKAPLGRMLDMHLARQEPPGWDEFWEQSEPAVEGDTVYVSPNVGAAFAVDRFTGKLRWGRLYDPALRISSRRVREARVVGPLEGLPRPLPKDRLQMLRYRNTPQVCGPALVIAPQDTSAAYGLDSHSGILLWTEPHLSGQTLIGGDETAAIFAGAGLVALDGRSGKPRWRYDPGRLAFISGPPVVSGGDVHIPLSDTRLVSISVETGRPNGSAIQPPTARSLLTADPVRKALEEAQILRIFAAPGTSQASSSL